MPSGLDKSLSEIIRGYGPKRHSRGSERRGAPYSSKSKHTDVHIGNVPWDTTWQDLKELCQEFGDVKRADIVKRPDGRSRGFGVVSFFNSSDAEACVEGLDGHDLDGRELRVKLDEHPATRRTNKVSNSGNCQVWVGNLPFSLKWQELKDMCKEYGFVKNVNLGENESGYSKGYAIVTMEDNAAAHACIKGLNGSDLDGRELIAKFDEKVSNRTSDRTTNKTNKVSGRGNCQVWVGNLPFSLQWQELKDICKEYGFVKNVTLEENEDGSSKGYAIVTMENNAAARACINDLNGSDLHGRELIAKFDEKASNQGTRQKSSNLESQMVGNHFLLNDGTDSNYQLWVGNLPYHVKWQEVKDLCKEYGFVQHVDLKTTDEGDSLGYAIVGFEDLSSARSCIEGLNGSSFEGRELIVKHDEKAGEGTSRVVYLGNLPFSTQWQEVKGMCQSFGDVVHVDIREDDEGGSKGYAVVKFEDTSAAQKCVKHLNGQMLNGREIHARFDIFEGVSDDEDPTTVYVGNLPWSFKKWSDLKNLCRNFGDVLRADIAEYEDGRSKGYGTVKFANGISARNCIRQLNGKLLNGRPLYVKVDMYE